MGQILNPNSDPLSVDRWAIVKNGNVVNVIVAAYQFITIIQNQYDFLIDISVSQQTANYGDLYDSVNNVFSTPPPVIPPLSVCQMQNLAAFNVAIQAFSDSCYVNQIQFRFFMLYYFAVQGGLTNRAAYITPLFNWANSVIAYAATYTATVMAITDPATALNHQWDFTQIMADPKVTLFHAIQISN